MKKIFVSVIFSLFSLTSLAQDLNGIGDFKIGMDIESFLKIPEIASRNLKDLDFNSNFHTNTDNVFKNTNLLNNRNHIIHSHEVVDFYFMADLGVSGGWGNWYTTEIRFYKNQLISISITGVNTEFAKLLVGKYGEPVKSGEIKKIVCQNKFGAKYLEYDGIRHLKWKTNKSIQGTYTEMVFCGDYKPNSSGYTVSHIMYSDVVRVEENRISKIKEKEELIERLSSSRL